MLQMMLPKLENPWRVESLYEFQYFKCPSCEFEDGKKQEFLNHAYEYHPESTDYLRIITDGSLNDVMCPWNNTPENEKLSKCNQDHGIEDFKTEDVEDISDINEDSNQNDHAVIQDYGMEYFKTENVEDIPDLYEDSHEDSHQNDRVVIQMVKCYYCTKEMDRSNVRSHMQESHPSKPVIFNIIKDAKCIPEDKTKTIAIIKDVEINPPPESIMEKEFDHYETTNAITMVMCFHCSTALIYSDIRKHVQEQHPGEELIYFPINSVKTNDEVENVIHEDQSDFNCDPCGKSFDSVDTLIAHKKVHQIQCKICAKTFTEVGILKKHINSVHNGQNDNICDSCGKKFSTKKTLRYHVMAIHDQLKPYKCGSCEKAFVKKQKLNEHIKVIHMNQQDYPCNQCKKSFALKRYLEKHIKEVHGDNVYICEICSSAFSTTSGMKSHVKKFHEGDKSDMVICTQCGKSMTSNYLNRHMRIVHEGIKDVKCNICGKLFTEASKLKLHISSGKELYLSELYYAKAIFKKVGKPNFLSKSSTLQRK